MENTKYILNHSCSSVCHVKYDDDVGYVINVCFNKFAVYVTRVNIKNYSRTFEEFVTKQIDFEIYFPHVKEYKIRFQIIPQQSRFIVLENTHSLGKALQFNCN